MAGGGGAALREGGVKAVFRAQSRQGGQIGGGDSGGQVDVRPRPGQREGLVEPLAAPVAAVAGAGDGLSGPDDVGNLIGVVQIDRADAEDLIHL